MKWNIYDIYACILFTRLAEYGIIVHPNKCVFGLPELDFLGHHVSAAGITPLSESVKAIVYNNTIFRSDRNNYDDSWE